MKRADRAAPENRYAQQRNEARFTLLLALISVAALLYYYAKQQLLLYGDAVAHLNIARRVVDNRHPIESYGQLGTVWLPLQHIAMLPFVWVQHALAERNRGRDTRHGCVSYLVRSVSIVW